MKIKFLICVLPWLAMSACSSDPTRTHRGELLDDKVTSERVQAELSRAGTDFKNVHVRTTNGVVELSGTVRSAEVRSHAEAIARTVHRVNGIEDHVQVER